MREGEVLLHHTHTILAELDRADGVFARIIPSGSLEQIIFRVDALHRLEERGIRVVNSPRAIERTINELEHTKLDVETAIGAARAATPRKPCC